MDSPHHGIHDAVCFPITPRRCPNPVRGQKSRDSILLITTGRIPAMGEHILVLRTSRSLHCPISGNRSCRRYSPNVHKETTIRCKIHCNVHRCCRSDQLHRLGASHVRHRSEPTCHENIHGVNRRGLTTIRRNDHRYDRVFRQGEDQAEDTSSIRDRLNRSFHYRRNNGRFLSVGGA